MLAILKKILGIGPGTDYAELVKQGATILDVRTKGEYSTGHIKGSINIPVEQLDNNIGKLKDKNKTIITCCASGMRSASAKGILTTRGFTSVYNGGAWQNLDRKLG